MSDTGLVILAYYMRVTGFQGFLRRYGYYEGVHAHLFTCRECSTGVLSLCATKMSFAAACPTSFLVSSFTSAINNENSSLFSLYPGRLVMIRPCQHMHIGMKFQQRHIRLYVVTDRTLKSIRVE